MVRARPTAVLVAVAMMAATVLATTRAAWAVDLEPVHLQYSAPPGCPLEDALVAAAAEMGGTFRAASAGEPARSFDVVIEKTDQGFAGSLSVLAPGGEQRARTVTCARCASVVRALGLFVALALADGPPAAPSPPAADEATPVAAPVDDVERVTPPPPVVEDPGGLAAIVTWDTFRAAPTGVGVVAVAPGPTHFGGVAFATRESLSQYDADGPASGVALRLGAIAAWGAPWSRDEWLGFALEAGVRGGELDSTLPPGWSINGQTGKDWRWVAPYVAGSFTVALVPRLVVHPVVGLTALWSTDYRGDSTGSFALDVGVAWRAW